MIIAIYVKREDLIKLGNFLERGEILDICWSERMFIDYVQVNLNYPDYLRLLEISDKLEQEPVEEVVEEEVNFWNLDEENLKVFNEKGLYSLQQMKDSFLAGSTYFDSLQSKERGEVFTEPVDFKTWFEKDVLRITTTGN